MPHQKLDAELSSRISANGELLAWVLGKCSDCTAQIATLTAPWISPVSAGAIFVYAVRDGSCRLDTSASDRSLDLFEGDIVVLPQCNEHQLQNVGSSIGVHVPQTQWFEPLCSPTSAPTHDRHQRSTTLLISCFRKPARQSTHLLAALPPFIVRRRETSEPNHCLESTIRLLENEIVKQNSDHRILGYLTKVLILQVNRYSLLLSANQAGPTNLQMSDDVIRRALGLMHSRPDLSWTVATLATAVGVSRSTFAARFAVQMREAPLSYLRRERMKQAADLLADETLGLKEIAALVGYDSESAFSNAFKQWSGIPPGTFRRERTSEP